MTSLQGIKFDPASTWLDIDLTRHRLVSKEKPSKAKIFYNDMEIHIETSNIFLHVFCEEVVPYIAPAYTAMRVLLTSKALHML